MGRITRQMPSGQGVAPGQTATFMLPLGLKYHALYLKYSGTTFNLSHIPEIRVLINNKVVHRYSAVELNTMNIFDGRGAAAGVLTIPFDRYGLRTQQAETTTSINTAKDLKDPKARNVTNFTVQVDIDAAAVAPALSMTAEQSDGVAGGLGMILHRGKFNRSASGAGILEISDLPNNTVTALGQNKIVFIPSANDIDHIKVERNGYTVYDRSKALNELIQKDGVRTPQAGYIVIDRTEKGFGGDPMSLTGISDLRYELNTTGVCEIVVLTENLGHLGD